MLSVSVELALLWAAQYSQPYYTCIILMLLNEHYSRCIIHLCAGRQPSILYPNLLHHGKLLSVYFSLNRQTELLIPYLLYADVLIINCSAASGISQKTIKIRVGWGIVSERKRPIAFFSPLKSPQMVTVWEDEKATVHSHHTKIYFIQSMPVHVCVFWIQL